MYSGAAIDNLYPALAECFTIIVCGYVAGRIDLVSEMGAKGINTFISTFSLPSLIFMALAKLDLSTVNWMFLLSILIAKSIVFFATIAISLLVDRPVNLGRAGILGIFCTFSNDYAVGYPIVAALYKDSHPEYASYMYLMAPICLVYLNPIGFVLMEIGKQPTNNSNTTCCKTFVTISKGIIFNPIIAMTLLGIIGNLLFKHEVPSLLAGILNVFSSAFSASALFLLGFKMVGKIHKLHGATLAVSGILIIAKLVVTPLVMREVISMLHVGSNATETGDWSTFGFFYGTFPTGLTVFLFATQYNQNVDLVASALVACTFISAPLMFVSAKMVTLTNADPSEYVNKLHEYTFILSIAGFIACVLVILVFVVTKRLCRIPHRITVYLVFSQLLSCLGAILWYVHDQTEESFGYFQFAVFTIGVYSSRIWTMFLAVVLVMLRCRSLCFVLKLEPLFFVIGWGLPVILSTLFLVLDKQNSGDDDHDPNFVYGTSQAVIAVLLLFFSFITTVVCLIVHQRYSDQYLRQFDDTNQTSSEHQHQTIDDTEEKDPETFKHTVLLILLLCSIFVGLSLSIWTLVKEQKSGIYVELSFLDASLNIGQSIIMFAIFCAKDVATRIWQRFKKLWYGANELSLPSYQELSDDTNYLCDQFVADHLGKCIKDLAKNMRWRMKVYKNVFSGTMLVDWLIEVDLVCNRAEAVDYGRRLVEGRVLKHIHGVYDFRDGSLLYTFS